MTKKTFKKVSDIEEPVLTNDEIDTLVDNTKKRERHMFVKRGKLSDDEKLKEEIVENHGHVDPRTLAKKYGKQSSEIVDIISSLGYF